MNTFGLEGFHYNVMFIIVKPIVITINEKKNLREEFPFIVIFACAICFSGICYTEMFTIVCFIIPMFYVIRAIVS